MWNYFSIKRFKKYCALSIIVLLMVAACKTDYEKMISRELSSGERHDSLFLGLSFGMPSKAFFDHCWAMNKKKIFRHGSRGISVLYVLESKRDSIDMNFYPDFENDSIYQMPVTFCYRGWADWNQKLSQDTLLVEVLDLFKKWYGGEFIKVNFPETGDIYVKVDGNRQIAISKQKTSDVKAVFTDLTIDSKVRKRKKAEAQ